MVAAVRATEFRAVVKADLYVEEVELRAGQVIGDERQEAAHRLVDREVTSLTPALIGRVEDCGLTSTEQEGPVDAALVHEEFERVVNQSLNGLRERMRYERSSGVRCELVDDAELAVARICVEGLVQHEHVRGPARPEASGRPDSLALLAGVVAHGRRICSAAL